MTDREDMIALLISEGISDGRSYRQIAKTVLNAIDSMEPPRQPHAPPTQEEMADEARQVHAKTYQAHMRATGHLAGARGWSESGTGPICPICGEPALSDNPDCPGK